MKNLGAYLDASESRKLYEKQKEVIINAFVHVYGENNRKTIAKKIHEINVIFYNSLKHQKKAIDEKIAEYTTAYARAYAEVLGFDVSAIPSNKIDDFIFNTPELSFYFETMFGHPSSKWLFDDFAPIYAFRKDVPKSYFDEQDKLKVLNYYGISLDNFSLQEFEKTSEYEGINKMILTQIETLDKLKESFDIFVENTIGNYIRKYNFEYDKNNAVLHEKQEECMSYIYEVLKFDENFINLTKYMENYSNRPRLSANMSDFFCSFDDKNFKGIASFSKTYDDALIDPKVPDAAKEQILNERKLFYNDIGINLPLSEPISEFIKAANKIGIKIPTEHINYIATTRSQAKISAYLEIYKDSDELKQILNGRDLTLEQQAIFINLIASNKVCLTSINQQEKDSCDFPVQIIYTPYGEFPDYADVFLVHELNHYLQYNKSKSFFDKNKFYFTTGFDNHEMMTNRDRRKYQLLNEYFTQCVAVEATEYLHNELKSFIFNDDNAQTFGACAYDIFDIFLYEFYLDFKQVILDSTISGDPTIMYKAMGGQTAFETLNDLVNDFADVFYDNQLNGLELRNIIIKYTSENKQDVVICPERYLSGHQLELMQAFANIEKNFVKLMNSTPELKEIYHRPTNYSGDNKTKSVNINPNTCKNDSSDELEA